MSDMIKLTASDGFTFGAYHVPAKGTRKGGLIVVQEIFGVNDDIRRTSEDFAALGYEVVAPWGAAMARARTHPAGLVTSFCGDGSYLMLNSELYSAAFAGVPYVAIVCDNEGFAVIHRLQTNQGAEGFNNMLSDSRGPGAAPDGARPTRRRARRSRSRRRR